MVLGGRALKYHGCSSSGGNKSAYSRMSSSNVWWRAAIEQVRETLGAQVQEMGADQTGQNARDALRDAFRLGFETESQALRYVNVMVAMGPALAYEARHAAARRLLENTRLHPESRLDQMVAYAYDYLKDEA